MPASERRKRLSFRAILPSIVTILSLSAGLTAIKLSLDGRFEHAVVAIILAAVFDGIDGSLARLLKTASRFGAELDSLSDVIAFGVAPAMILYVWGLNQLGGIGWIVTLLYAVCMALRLARFNSMLDDDEEPRKRYGFLTGFPAPMAAYVALTPMMIDFEFTGVFSENLWLVALTTAFAAMGMVSKMPTYSLKQLFIRKDHMMYLLISVGMLVAMITTYQWKPVIVFIAGYMFFLPFSIRRFYLLSKKDKEKTPAA